MKRVFFSLLAMVFFAVQAPGVVNNAEDAPPRPLATGWTVKMWHWGHTPTSAQSSGDIHSRFKLRQPAKIMTWQTLDLDTFGALYPGGPIDTFMLECEAELPATSRPRCISIRSQFGDVLEAEVDGVRHDSDKDSFEPESGRVLRFVQPAEGAHVKVNFVHRYERARLVLTNEDCLAAKFWELGESLPEVVDFAKVCKSAPAVSADLCDEYFNRSLGSLEEQSGKAGVLAIERELVGDAARDTYVQICGAFSARVLLDGELIREFPATLTDEKTYTAMEDVSLAVRVPAGKRKLRIETSVVDAGDLPEIRCVSNPVVWATSTWDVELGEGKEMPELANLTKDTKPAQAAVIGLSQSLPSSRRSCRAWRGELFLPAGGDMLLVMSSELAVRVYLDGKQVAAQLKLDNSDWRKTRLVVPARRAPSTLRVDAVVQYEAKLVLCPTIHWSCRYWTWDHTAQMTPDVDDVCKQPAAKTFECDGLNVDDVPFFEGAAKEGFLIVAEAEFDPRGVAYTLDLAVDDGCKFFVDGELEFDAWAEASWRVEGWGEYTTDISGVRPVKLKLVYFQKDGHFKAVAGLTIQ